MRAHCCCTPFLPVTKQSDGLVDLFGMFIKSTLCGSRYKALLWTHF